ncbi:MAG: ornithine cyclodeaminase, partial [Pseudomonadota bacterium]|nr:ornithine cyclodeaminase [Pseudomonadota bacterium]
HLVSAADVHRICDWHRLVDALLVAHRGPTPLVDRSELHAGPEDARDTFLNLPAWQPGIAMGTKVVSVMPGNPRVSQALPAVQAAYVLFDGGTGTPLAVIDGTAMTYRKTAADSALGARFLVRRDARILLMVGAGALAPYLVAAHRAATPSIREVVLWNRDRSKAERLAHEVGGTVAGDLEQAVRRADIVSCATSSRLPLVRGAWLQRGAHLDLVGAYTPEMRECDDDAVRKARVFVDSRWFAVDRVGDLGDPIRRGVFTREAIEADLFELCANGLAQPRAPGDITLFKNGGGAHLDLFTARFIWDDLSR